MNEQPARWSHLAYATLMLFLLAGCSERRTMTPTSMEHWKVVDVGQVLTFRVPPDAEEQHLQAVDTIADVISGSGYEIMYEYGRFGAAIDQYRSQPGFAAQERFVDGRRAEEASFRADSPGSELPVVHLLQVPLEQGNVFTLRVSCVDESACELYRALFDSVTLN